MREVDAKHKDNSDPLSTFGDSLAGPANGFSNVHDPSSLGNGASFSGRYPLEALDHSTREYKLENGMNVVVISRPHTETTTVALAVSAGALHERTSEIGCAHFLEHMIFGNNKAIGPSGDITPIAREVGAFGNGATGWASTKFYLDTIPGNLDWALATLRKGVLEPKLDRSQMERERLVIIQETLQYPSSEACYSPLLRAHPRLKHGIGGNVDQVRKLTFEDLERYYKLHYTPSNMTLFIVGATDYLTAATIEREYGRMLPVQATDLTGRCHTGALIPYSKPGLEVNRVLRNDSKIEIRFRFDADSLNDFECAQLCLWVAENRIHDELRTSQGKIYAVEASISDLNEYHELRFGFCTAHPFAETSLEATLKILNDLRDNGITMDELETVKRLRPQQIYSESKIYNSMLFFISVQKRESIGSTPSLVQKMEASAAVDKSTADRFLYKTFKLSEAMVVADGPLEKSGDRGVRYVPNSPNLSSATPLGPVFRALRGRIDESSNLLYRHIRKLIG